jgi:HEAT repeat protein
MLVLIALCAIGLQISVWVWQSYFSPTHRWLRMVQDDNGAGHRGTAGGLAVLGKEPGISPAFAVTALLDALKSPHANVRADAALNLGGGGSESLRAVPALIAALDDASPSVRWGAVQSLGQLAADYSEVREQLIPHLVEAMEDPSPTVRPWAALHLGLATQPGDPAKQRVIEALAARLKDPDVQTRERVCWSLARLGRGDIAVPALIDALGDRRSHVRFGAAWTLYEVGPGAELAVPALAAFVRDEPDPVYRKHAIQTLFWIGGPEAFDGLSEPAGINPDPGSPGSSP